MNSNASTVAEQELFLEWVSFVNNLSEWVVFVTLTYKDECPYPDKAWMNYYALIADLNRRMFGKNYTRKVGHSYFSYAVAMEYQKRDVPHFHFLADQYIDFNYIHTAWGMKHGFAYIEKIKNSRNVCHYLAKYLLKGGEVSVYKKSYNKDENKILTQDIRNRMEVLKWNIKK